MAFRKRDPFFLLCVCVCGVCVAFKGRDGRESCDAFAARNGHQKKKTKRHGSLKAKKKIKPKTLFGFIRTEVKTELDRIKLLSSRLKTKKQP